MSQTHDLIFFGSAILRAGRQLLDEDFDQESSLSRVIVGGFLLKQVCEGYIRVWLVRKSIASYPVAIDAAFLLAVPIEEISEACAIPFSIDQMASEAEPHWLYLDRAQFQSFLAGSHRIDGGSASVKSFRRVGIADINERISEIVIRLNSISCSEVAKELVRVIEGQSASEDKRRVAAVRSLMGQNGGKKADLIDIRASSQCK